MATYTIANTATSGQPAKKAELLYRRPSLSTTLYSSGNVNIASGNEGTFASKGTPPSGWDNTWGICKFNTGNRLVIPRNIDQESKLVNISSSAQTANFSLLRTIFRCPGTSGADSTSQISASQINGIDIIFTTFTLTGSYPAQGLSALGSRTVTLSGTNTDTEWVIMGISSWDTGHKWISTYGIEIATQCNTGSMYLTNIHKKNAYPTASEGAKTATVTVVAYKLLFNAQKSRVVKSNGLYPTIQAAQVNNIKFEAGDSCRYARTGTISVGTGSNAGATATLSGSTTSGWTSYPAPLMATFNTGYKWLAPCAVSANSIRVININHDTASYSGNPNFYAAQYKWT